MAISQHMPATRLRASRAWSDIVRQWLWLLLSRWMQ